VFLTKTKKSRTAASRAAGAADVARSRAQDAATVAASRAQDAADLARARARETAAQVVPKARDAAAQAAAQVVPLSKRVGATATQSVEQGVHDAREWAAPRLEDAATAVSETVAPKVSVACCGPGWPWSPFSWPPARPWRLFCASGSRSRRRPTRARRAMTARHRPAWTPRRTAGCANPETLSSKHASGPWGAGRRRPMRRAVWRRHRAYWLAVTVSPLMVPELPISTGC